MMTIKLSPLLLIVAFSALYAQVNATHEAYCTDNKDGTGPPTYQITKDCCAATAEHRSTFFNEATHTCQDGPGDTGNGINLGRFVRCCGDRGAGSHSDG